MYRFFANEMQKVAAKAPARSPSPVPLTALRDLYAQQKEDEEFLEAMKSEKRTAGLKATAKGAALGAAAPVGFSVFPWLAQVGARKEEIDKAQRQIYLAEELKGVTGMSDRASMEAAGRLDDIAKGDIGDVADPFKKLRLRHDSAMRSQFENRFEQLQRDIAARQPSLSYAERVEKARKAAMREIPTPSTLHPPSDMWAKAIESGKRRYKARTGKELSGTKIHLGFLGRKLKGSLMSAAGIGAAAGLGAYIGHRKRRKKMRLLRARAEAQYAR